MVRLGRIISGVFVCVVLWACPVYGDKIVLINNDITTGVITSYENGMLVIQTELMGEIHIRHGDVKYLEVSKELPVQLEADPRLLQARVICDKDGIRVITGDDSQTVKWGAIKALGEAAEKLHLPPAPPDKSYKFSGNLSAGFSGYQGNVNMDIMTSNIVLKLANPTWAYRAYFNSYYGQLTTDGDQTPFADMMNTGGSVRRQLNDKCSTTLSIDQNRNDFIKLKFRNSTTGVFGFRWFNQEHFRYETLFGAGHEYEEVTEKHRIVIINNEGNEVARTFDEVDPQNSGIGTLTSDMVFKVNDHVDLSQKTTWIPRLDDEKDYRIVADSAATIYLDKARKLFLKTGIRHEYDTSPSYKIEQLDTYYFSNVGYSF